MRDRKPFFNPLAKSVLASALEKLTKENVYSVAFEKAFKDDSFKPDHIASCGDGKINVLYRFYQAPSSLNTSKEQRMAIARAYNKAFKQNLRKE